MESVIFKNHIKIAITLSIIAIISVLLLGCSDAFAASGGVCKETAQEKARHVFFNIETGRQILLDIRKLKKTEIALELEKKLLTIDRRNKQLIQDLNKKCEESKDKLEKALGESSKLISDYKKQLSIAWSEILVLKGKVQKLKRQRVTFFLIGFGVGAAIAGGVALAINFGVQDDKTLRAGLIGAGAGGIVAGATLIGIAIFR